jgi:hypothetical protein
MRATLFVLLITACSDSPNGAGGDLASIDLASQPGSVKCGATTCASDEICAVFDPRPEPFDMTPAGRQECAKLPAACVNDASCACLESNGGSSLWCYQLFSASLICDDQFSGQIICSSS